ncbi:MAG TPA: hypothetical protein VHF89_14995 [Solirubrobacteraceae bacterium]|nr:hypothetical protein [Solirubrobacteraceae bacterium]
MNPIARGWRRFRRLPGILQAATWLALVAAYSVLLFALLGGGDDEPATVGTPQQPKARPLTAQEREVAALVAGAPVGRGLPREQNDVEAFRRPRVKSVTCEELECEIVYSVGLPGRGRLLNDQRAIWERLFRRTPIVKATITIVRDTAAAGVPAKANEETAPGAPMLRTTCDRSGQRDVDWASARGAQILVNICEIDAFDQGEIHRQEPVAPDDETARDPDLPRPVPGG